MEALKALWIFKLKMFTGQQLSDVAFIRQQFVQAILQIGPLIFTIDIENEQDILKAREVLCWFHSFF